MKDPDMRGRLRSELRDLEGLAPESLAPLSALRPRLEHHSAARNPHRASSIPAQVLNTLHFAGVRYVEELEGVTEKILLAQRGFGRHSLEVLRASLQDFGVFLERQGPKVPLRLEHRRFTQLRRLGPTKELPRGPELEDRVTREVEDWINSEEFRGWDVFQVETTLEGSASMLFVGITVWAKRRV